MGTLLKNYRYLITGLLVFLIAACGSTAIKKSDSTVGRSNPWLFLPTHELKIEGGNVTFQSALIVDGRRPLKNPWFQDYPTKYILPTTNKSNFPIWVEVEWRVPGEEPFVSFGRLKSKQFGEFYWKVKDTVWNTHIPVKVKIYADENKINLLGMKDLALQFPEGKDKEQFLLKAKEVNSITSKVGGANGHKVEMPLLSGFEVAK